MNKTLNSDVQLCMCIAINQVGYNFYILLSSDSFMVTQAQSY